MIHQLNSLSVSEIENVVGVTSVSSSAGYSDLLVEIRLKVADLCYELYMSYSAHMGEWFFIENSIFKTDYPGKIYCWTEEVFSHLFWLFIENEYTNNVRNGEKVTYHYNKGDNVPFSWISHVISPVIVSIRSNAYHNRSFEIGQSREIIVINNLLSNFLDNERLGSCSL